MGPLWQQNQIQLLCEWAGKTLSLPAAQRHTPQHKTKSSLRNTGTERGGRGGGKGQLLASALHPHNSSPTAVAERVGREQGPGEVSDTSLTRPECLEGGRQDPRTVNTASTESYCDFAVWESAADTFVQSTATDEEKAASTDTQPQTSASFLHTTNRTPYHNETIPHS